MIFLTPLIELTNLIQASTLEIFSFINHSSNLINFLFHFKKYFGTSFESLNKRPLRKTDLANISTFFFNNFFFQPDEINLLSKIFIGA